MTHYKKSYADLKGSRKRWKALLDCRDFLGKERFAKVREIIREQKAMVPGKKFTAPMIMEWWHMNLSMAGIQGYPVVALVLSYAKGAKGYVQ